MFISCHQLYALGFPEGRLMYIECIIIQLYYVFSGLIQCLVSALVRVHSHTAMLKCRNHSTLGYFIMAVEMQQCSSEDLLWWILIAFITISPVHPPPFLRLVFIGCVQKRNQDLPIIAPFILLLWIFYEECSFSNHDSYCEWCRAICNRIHSFRSFLICSLLEQNKGTQETQDISE